MIWKRWVSLQSICNLSPFPVHYHTQHHTQSQHCVSRCLRNLIQQVKENISPFGILLLMFIGELKYLNGVRTNSLFCLVWFF